MLKTKDLKNKIKRKLSSVPQHKLREIYKIVLSDEASVRDKRGDILSYAGSWKEMSKKEFTDFMKNIKSRRKFAFSQRER